MSSLVQHIDHPRPYPGACLLRHDEGTGAEARTLVPRERIPQKTYPGSVKKSAISSQLS